MRTRLPSRSPLGTDGREPLRDLFDLDERALEEDSTLVREPRVLRQRKARCAKRLQDLETPWTKRAKPKHPAAFEVFDGRSPPRSAPVDRALR